MKAQTRPRINCTASHLSKSNIHTAESIFEAIEVLPRHVIIGARSTRIRIRTPFLTCERAEPQLKDQGSILCHLAPVLESYGPSTVVEHE